MKGYQNGNNQTAWNAELNVKRHQVRHKHLQAIALSEPKQGEQHRQNMDKSSQMLEIWAKEKKHTEAEILVVYHPIKLYFIAVAMSQAWQQIL